MGSDTRSGCHESFREQYIQLRKFFIPFSLGSHDRYYFNILRMITLLYHMYIEHEIYHTAYKKVKNPPKQLSINRGKYE